MNSVLTASIELRADDGSLIAVLRITSDMDGDGPLEVAPILQVLSDERHPSETEFQLRESGRYYYDLLPVRSFPRLKLRCGLAKRRASLGQNEPDSGRIETRSFCGSLLLEAVEDDPSGLSGSAIATAFVDVRSIKLGYRSQYRGMLRSLMARVADLVADARSSTKMPLRSNFEERDDKEWFQVQLELLRDVIEDPQFGAALQRILSYPHERLEQDVEQLPVGRPFRWSSKVAQSVATASVRRTLPIGHPLREASGLDSVADRIPVTRKRATIDTAENRFVKHVLRDFEGFLSRAHSLFREAGADWSAASGTANRLLAQVSQWLSRPFFVDLGDMVTLPLGSPVIQRKGGYRDLMRWWLQFRTAAELSWRGGEDVFGAGQRNVAELYEYWLFFVLVDWFQERFGSEPLAISHFIDGLETGLPQLRLKKRVTVGPFGGLSASPLRRMHASFVYNGEFVVTRSPIETGSWTRKMHPDYTLTFWPAIEGMTSRGSAKLATEQGLLIHIHLDAKYRVNNLSELFGPGDADDADDEDSNNVGNYKRQDLLKMHAYRDAIRHSEGAYVLYPGGEEDRRHQFRSGRVGSERWPHTMRGFHEIVPGLGAFAIAPDENGAPSGLSALAAFVDEVIDNFSNRASFREDRAAFLHETLRRRESLQTAGEPDTGEVALRDAAELDPDGLRNATPSRMIALMLSCSTAECDWMLSRGKLVVGLGDRRGSFPLVRGIALAHHALLVDIGGDPRPGLLRLENAKGDIWTQAI